VALTEELQACGTAVLPPDERSACPNPGCRAAGACHAGRQRQPDCQASRLQPRQLLASPYLLRRQGLPETPEDLHKLDTVGSVWAFGLFGTEFRATADSEYMFIQYKFTTIYSFEF